MAQSREILKELDLSKGHLRTLVLLSPKKTEDQRLETVIKKCKTVKNTETFTRTSKTINGMKQFVWKGHLNSSCSELSKELAFTARDSKLPVWLSHVTENETAAFDSFLSDSTYLYDVVECSLGTLVDPFTFVTHMSWQKDEQRCIEARFDFDLNVLHLELKQEQRIQLEMLFSELKKAFIVQEDETFYGVYMYMSSFPKLGKEECVQGKPEERPSRITTIPGSEQSDIGNCSVLRLLLKKEEGNFVSLFDKLGLTEFKIWWASGIENVPKTNESLPWSVRWLLSVGHRVSDQLSHRDIRSVIQHEDVLYSALQGMLSRQVVVDVMEELQSFLQDNTFSSVQSLSYELPHNYALIPKVVVTPTRLIFLPPEPVQMNRVLRQYNPTKFASVVFRDENQQYLSSMRQAFSEDFFRRIKTFLSEGLKVEGRTYRFLGCSNSQLREHGCWMYAKDPDSDATVEEIRNWVGDLTGIRCVALYVSRLGQFFSSSANAVDLSKSDYKIKEIPDVERNGYCFTDGVGKISTDVAEEVARQLGLKPLCSAFQIRLGGCKGVLVIDPTIPEGEIHIRPSMKKFESLHQVLEVVYYSRPSRAYLNHQVVTLLSQQGIDDGVFFDLQEDHLHSMLEMFVSNGTACQELDDVSAGLNIGKIREKGIDIVSDAFFRSLLLVKYEEQLTDLLEKARITIPSDKGRVLMGVADESGNLREGQVFIRYSENVDDSTSKAVVLEGPVVVTKNPCLHPGDVRRFEAVDCPELHHLVDCIAFPIQGDRPHCNEISGSDLDGDLYWTTWHDGLIIRENAEAMEFPKVERKELKRQPTQEDIIEYIGEFITKNDVGVIANAHLAHADEKGIFSDECLQLAGLHSAAVDFPKTGQPTCMKVELAPHAYPDFMMKSETNQYDSKRILGKLFRNVSRLCLSKRLNIDDTREHGLNIKCRNNQLESAFEKIKDSCHDRQEEIRKYFNGYAARFQCILDKYGFNDESQAIAGTLHHLKQSSLLRSARHEVPLLLKMEINKLAKDYKDIFVAEIELHDPVKEALIWYKVAYEDKRFKSFAWLAWSVVLSRDIEVSVDQFHPDSFLDGNNDFFDENVTSFITFQKDACKTFTSAIEAALPTLQCTLVPRELIRYVIPSSDVYIQLKHAEISTLERDFAELCCTIPTMPNTHSWYITETGLHLTLRVAEQECSVHIYKSGTYVESLAAMNILSDLERKLLQGLSQFWMKFAKRELKEIISVHQLKHLVSSLVNQEDNNSSLLELMHKTFLFYTDFKNVLDLRRQSTLWNLSDDCLRLFQQNLFEGLQLLVLSKSCRMLQAEYEADCNQRRRKVIFLSSKTSGFIREEKQIARSILALRTGCKVQIKQGSDQLAHRYIVEGLGTEKQILRLTNEVRHFEDTVNQVVTFSNIPSTSHYRKISFEESSNEDDQIVIIRYKGKTGLKRRNFFELFTAFARPLAPKKTFEGIIRDYMDIIANTRTHYDEGFLGDIRLACHFGRFHFSARKAPNEVTLKTFMEQIHGRDKGWKSSYYYVHVDERRVRETLKEEGLEPDGVRQLEYRTLVRLNMQHESAEKHREKRTVKVTLNEHLQIQHLHHPEIRWGSVEFLRKQKTDSLDKMADIRIRLETMRNVKDMEMEPYKWITESDVPLLIEEEKQSCQDRDSMPCLKPHEKWEDHVTFIRQKQVSTYRYLPSKVVDHFTAFVRVELSKVREYVLNESAGNCPPKEFTDVSIYIPTVPPLFHEKEHAAIIRRLMELSLKISESSQ